MLKPDFFWYAICYSPTEELILQNKFKVMKTIVSSIIVLLVTAGMALKAQNRSEEYLGLPGDNLNLYAVMNLFQESQTLEEFEKNLNAEDSRINNLDLNNDNYVDYIMVTDYPDGDVHNIVLQVAMGPNEKQDVAVFTVQRFNNGSAQIQLIGDEALYGRNYIVEPIYDETPNPGYTGRRARNRDTYVRTTYYEVAAWPMIQFIYEPYYSPWRSSWHWGYYPVYWHAWTPFYWHYYYGYHHNYYPVYYSHYRHCNTFRYTRYNDFYYHNVRSYSPTVVVNINKGHYKSTYSRPQSRRDGEALYSRTHSERSSNFSSGNSRRSSGSVTNSRTVNSESSGRRSTSSDRVSTNRGERATSSRNQVERSSQPSDRRQSSPSVQRDISTRSTQSSSDRSYRTEPTRSTQSSSDRTIRTQPVQRSSRTQESSTVSSRSSRPSYDQSNQVQRSSSSAPSSVQRSERSSGSVSGRSERSSGSASVSRSASRSETRSAAPRSSKSASSSSSGSRRSSSDSENSRSSRR
jgi:hypothetical protein